MGLAAAGPVPTPSSCSRPHSPAHTRPLGEGAPSPTKPTPERAITTLSTHLKGSLSPRMGFPGHSVVKNLSHLPIKSHRFEPWVGKIPWRRKWQPPPAFLPGESHGQRSPVGCSPGGRNELDTTEVTAQHQHPWNRPASPPGPLPPGAGEKLQTEGGGGPKGLAPHILKIQI